MRRSQNTANGRVIFGFYDTHLEHYTLAYPRLEEIGWPAMAAVIAGEVAAPLPTQMGQAQVQALGRAGWDIAVHGNATADDYETMDFATALAALTAAQTYLVGLTVRGPAALASPAPRCNADSFAAAQTLFNYITDGGGWTYEQYPSDRAWNPYRQNAHDAIAWGTVTGALDTVVGDPLRVIELGFHDIVDGAAVGLQTSVERLEALIAYVASLDCIVTTYTRLDRAALTRTDGLVTAPAAGMDAVMAAASLSKENGVLMTGRDLLVAHNSGAGMARLFIQSEPDPMYQRGANIQYALHAGDVAVFGPFTLPGWRGTENYVQVVSTSADVMLGTVTIPAKTE